MHAIIVLIGGVFIRHTATKEILRMISLEDIDAEKKGPQPVARTMMFIVAMNLLFSFNSILSAMALFDVFIVMAVAIVVSCVLLGLLAYHVSEFLRENRRHKVLGLFILFLVGVLLMSEGGHLSYLHLAVCHITPISTAT